MFEIGIVDALEMMAAICMRGR